MNATPLTPELYMDLFNRHQALQATVEALQAQLKGRTAELERVREELAETSLYLQQERANRDSLDATTPAVCPDCNGEGAVDSGGTDPNGNPLMRRCGCREKGGDGE